MNFIYLLIEILVQLLTIIGKYNIWNFHWHEIYIGLRKYKPILKKVKFFWKISKTHSANPTSSYKFLSSSLTPYDSPPQQLHLTL